MINRRAGSKRFTAVDEETQALLDFADQLWRASEGLFDITSGPLRRAWQFQGIGSAEPEHIASALELVGWHHVQREAASILLPLEGMEIDLGGLVKEYAVDSAIRLMRDAGVRSAMLELAGDVGVLGSQANGHPWQIGVRDPFESGSICTLNLADSSVATSGSYERKLNFSGKDYGHLLDPRSGWPTEGPVSVSVIGQSCLIAGAISTVACLHEEEKAIEWLEEANLPWLMVNRLGGTSGPIASDLTQAT
jgi:thiamine biosynthesis lipoprotein